MDILSIRLTHFDGCQPWQQAMINNGLDDEAARIMAAVVK
jgi:hypothetical protein